MGLRSVTDRPDLQDHPGCQWGTAEGSRELDRILDKCLTFLEKIQWLEEAENLTPALKASSAGSTPTQSGDD